jgi:hypothetical protein
MYIEAPAYEAILAVIQVAAGALRTQSPAAKPRHQLGACGEVRANGLHPVRPIFDAEHYFLSYKKGPAVLVRKGPHLVVREVESEIHVAKPPTHGTLNPWVAYPGSTSKTYHYTPDKDYAGRDGFDVDVSLEGTTLRIHYQFMVFAEDENSNQVGFCNWDGGKYYWKISQRPARSTVAPVR